MRTGVAIAIGIVIGALGVVAAGVAILYMLTPPPEKFAENYVRKREAELGMSCQTASSRAQDFIQQHVPSIIKAAESRANLNEGYGALRNESDKLLMITQVCAALAPKFKETGLTFPRDLLRQYKVISALNSLLETQQKETEDPSEFGHVWKSAAVNLLQMTYDDLTAGSKSDAQQEHPRAPEPGR
jgi:hypothetical protein